MKSESQLTELSHHLRQVVRGDVAFDSFSRGRYATDASVYQMFPVGVVTPQNIEDVQHCIDLCGRFSVPLLARGGGTSQCGQTVNNALVLDNTRHLNRLLDLDVAAQRCTVEPGIVLDELNRQLKPHQLWFPVDVSTASRATIGGMTANNSCGQRSIYYGTMRDNVHAVEAILPNNQPLRFGEHAVDSRADAADGQTLWSTLLALGEREAEEIRERFPDVLRRVGGYNLDALIPQSGMVNFAHLLVGSEGTLAYSRSIELKLSPLPQQRVLGICHFPTFYQAMDAAQHLVTLNPRGVELVDATMIALARDIPMYRATVEQFVRGQPAAVLLVEFAFEEQTRNLQHLKLLHEKMHDLGYAWSGDGDRWGGVVDAVDPTLQAAINEVRKAGLNIMMSMKSEGKPVSFVEDCAVALPDLAEYTAALTEVFHKHQTTGTWYAHASVGCLHVRPVLNLKLEQDAKTMRAIAEEATDLVLKYKGSHSGEHGDGISRSEFHEKMFGVKLVEAFGEVKQLFDPDNIFNPGKIVNAPRMNDRTLFRYPPDYKIQPLRNQLDWQGWSGAGGGFQGAIEMCNNNGACRKLKGGVMCPSFRVTGNERDVTRGRANSLRLAISGQLGDDALTSAAMADTMKLCVSCKGCKRECPTGVDMARMKIEVQAAQAAAHGFSVHDRLVAYLPRYAPWASRISGLLNLRNRWALLARWLEPLTGFSAQRALPQWRSGGFQLPASATELSETEQHDSRDVVLFADTFNTWFEPENLHAAVSVLSAAGYRLHFARSSRRRARVCCGRTWLAAGMVDKARDEARHTMDVLRPYVERGIPVVGLEPSCLLTLRDEYLALCPGDEAEQLASRALLLEEFIAAEVAEGRFDLPLKTLSGNALLHGHCHQKAFAAMSSVETALSLIPGLNVKTIESSCCGMAGSFGYAKDTAEVSQQMAELDLLPTVRNAADDALIIADGTSCRHQIELGAARSALHVARVLEMALPDQAG